MGIKRSIFYSCFVFILFCFILSSASEPKKEKQATDLGASYEQILKSPSENWLTYHGDYKAHRHSPLKQINKSNVAKLELEWTYIIHGAANLRVTPLVFDGIMYVTNVNEVHALNAATGEIRWIWSANKTPRMGLNRGVALLGKKVFFVTEDCRLTALDYKTGELAWQKKYADAEGGYYATFAPLALKDRIIVGVSGDKGVRGFVAAFAASDGQELWRFWTVPSRDEKASESWGENTDLERGGAGAWMNGSYDPELGLIYWPTGNPWPVFEGQKRSGDNLYSQSILALDANSGKLKWHFQFTTHDTHGWDASESPVLVDATWHGFPRKLLLQANRNGFFYALDRVTGEFLLGKPFVTKLTWAKLDNKGRPIFNPGTETWAPTLCPWLRGATNWWSPSYDPSTKLFYVTALEQCGKEKGDFFLRAIDPQSGKIKWEHPMPGPSNMTAGIMTTATGLVFAGDDQSQLIALDAVTGELLWRADTGHAIFASPMSYAINGQQYIAIAAGADILTFSLSP